MKFLPLTVDSTKESLLKICLKILGMAFKELYLYPRIRTKTLINTIPSFETAEQKNLASNIRTIMHAYI